LKHQAAEPVCRDGLCARSSAMKSAAECSPTWPQHVWVSEKAHRVSSHTPVQNFEERVAALLNNVARELESEHRAALEEQKCQFQLQMESLRRGPSQIVKKTDLLSIDSSRSFEISIGVDNTLAGTEAVTEPDMEHSQQGGMSSSVATQGSLQAPASPVLIGYEPTLHMGSATAAPSAFRVGSTASMAPMGEPRLNHRAGQFYRVLEDWMGTEEDFSELDKAQIAQLQYYANLNKLLGGYESHNGSQRGSGYPVSLYRPACFMMDPGCKFRVFWDTLAAVFLAYDLISIPMAVFEIPQTGFVLTLSLTIMFYWTLDIVLNFFVGYHIEHGDVELRFSLVARRYIRSWLAPDVAIVTFDWVSYGPSLMRGNIGDAQPVESAGLLRLGKITRVVRVMRVLRLLRFGKIRTIIQRVHDSIGMESTAIIFGICKNLLIIIMINHCLAACWFWIGKQSEDGWLLDRESNVWLENYLMAMHWSIANFTPGSSGIQARTPPEYAFHIFVLFFAMVVFSVFVSSTTSMITKLMGMQSSRSQQLWILKGFLLQHHFAPELRDRVLRYVQTALGNRRDLIHRSDVDLLNMLSQPLREEVQMQLHLVTLRCHPLIKLCSLANRRMMQKLTAEALQEMAFSRSDTIFSPLEHTDKMSFVVAGVLRYTPYSNSSGKELPSDSVAEAVLDADSDSQHDSHQGSNHPADVLLGPSDFFCEAPLWTKWSCRGTMVADADCDLLDVIGASFRKSVKQHHIMTNLVKQYAAAFIEVLNLASAGCLEKPLSDLQESYILEGPLVKVLNEPELGLSSTGYAIPGLSYGGMKKSNSTNGGILSFVMP